MLNINTNLSSLIVQNSLKQSTNRLKTAIERLTTGFKINHAKDNAANYSIATNMTTKLGALQVAEDNCAMGLDMLATANGTLDQIHDKLQRLRDLAVQASNGTYGTQSKQAINTEANALVDEIERLYNTTEYNGINLMKGQVTGSEESNFIKDIDRRDTSKMTTLASVNVSTKLNSGTYSISTPEELAKLATMTNNGLIGENCEFVLGADIDLSGYANWEPIGSVYYDNNMGRFTTDGAHFEAIFDGNGFKIINLVSKDSSLVGLFGAISNSCIKNLALENVTIQNSETVSNLAYPTNLSGAITAHMQNSNIENCYVTGLVEGVDYIGGIAGYVGYSSTVKNTYCEATVNATGYYVGGIAGTIAKESRVTNSFATGDVSTSGRYAGGITGVAGDGAIIDNSYSLGNIFAAKTAGGISGAQWNGSRIANCYVSGDISSNSLGTGGITGFSTNSGESNSPSLIQNCYVLTTSAGLTGIFSGFIYSGNLVIKDCYYNEDILTTPIVYESTIDYGGIYNYSNINTCKSTDIPYFLEKSSNILFRQADINFQININSNETSGILYNLESNIGSLDSYRMIGSKYWDNLSKLDETMNKVLSFAQQAGTTENRLYSALDEISTQYENLVSSRSTLQDADIAEVSSEYIRQQILQQASATLMSTANQSASIALQLI